MINICKGLCFNNVADVLYLQPRNSFTNCNFNPITIVGHAQIS